MEHITLYFRHGSSDKIYQASIEPKDDRFVVQFSYGRRGSALQSGAKTQSPVTHEQAKSIYDKLVAAKTAKGYSSGADGTPYQQPIRRIALPASIVSCSMRSRKIRPKGSSPIRLGGSPKSWMAAACSFANKPTPSLVSTGSV